VLLQPENTSAEAKHSASSQEVLTRVVLDFMSLFLDALGYLLKAAHTTRTADQLALPIPVALNDVYATDFRLPYLAA
jgi:hypothetical protein